MEKHIVVQAVCRNRIVDIIVFEGVPVLGQPLGTEHKHGFIAVFIILDDRQRCERFTKANAVCQNTAVELFKFIDDGQHGIALEVV